MWRIWTSGKSRPAIDTIIIHCIILVNERLLLQFFIKNNNKNIIYIYKNRVDMFVRQSWIESRLDMPDYIFEEGDDYVTLPPEFFDSLWQPDPYFLNAKVSGE